MVAQIGVEGKKELRISVLSPKSTAAANRRTFLGPAV